MINIEKQIEHSYRINPTAEIISQRIKSLCCDHENHREHFSYFHFKYLDLWNVPHPCKTNVYYEDNDTSDDD